MTIFIGNQAKGDPEEAEEEGEAFARIQAAKGSRRCSAGFGRVYR